MQTEHDVRFPAQERFAKTYTTYDPVFGPRIPFWRCAYVGIFHGWTGEEKMPCGAEISYQGDGWFHSEHYACERHDAVPPEGAVPGIGPEE